MSLVISKDLNFVGASNFHWTVTFRFVKFAPGDRKFNYKKSLYNRMLQFFSHSFLTVHVSFYSFLFTPGFTFPNFKFTYPQNKF